jgi:hypothetical protein
VLKSFNYAPIFEVARIVICAAFRSLFETKWRSKYVCATLQCGHQGSPRTLLTTFLPPIKKSQFFCLQYKLHESSCSKASIMHQFSRSHGSSFARRFGPYSRPNGGSTTFVRRYIVSSRYSKDSVNHLLASDKKIMRFRAQKVQLCTIFEVARIVICAACWSLFETKWRSNYVCATPHCVIQALQ